MFSIVSERPAEREKEVRCALVRKIIRHFLMLTMGSSNQFTKLHETRRERSYRSNGRLILTSMLAEGIKPTVLAQYQKCYLRGAAVVPGIPVVATIQ